MKQYFLPLFMLATPAWAEPAVEKLYRNHCASCHGKDLTGGLGGSLVDGQWKHGADDEDIARNIREGLPDLGMEGWEGLFTPDQIRSMVIYIREKEREHQLKTQPPPRPDFDEVTQTQHESYRVEEITRELRTPWGMDFLPNGQMLITERSGQLLLLNAAHSELTRIKNTPAVVQHGQGGLMEVAVHPDYETNGWIYLGLTEGKPSSPTSPPSMTAIHRGRLQGDTWVDHEIIYRANTKFYSTSGLHFGTRIVFDKGYIYFVVGERGGWHEAQDLSRPNGKVFRLHEDGGIPKDNPFVNIPNALPGIWSYGHRNPQGMDRDPVTGELYAAEHGPRGGDELNWIRPGKNYGWPVTTHGMNYNGKPITAETQRPGIEDPVLHWTPSIAPCGMSFYKGELFPNWSGDLFVGSLRFEGVHRLRIKEHTVVEEEVILKGLGRVRDVVTGPDGHLYIVLNRPGRILRLLPELMK